MSLIFNTNEVLTVNNLLLEYSNSKDTIRNLIEKMSFSIQTPETTFDTLYKVYTKEIISTPVINILKTNIVNNNEVLKTIPMKIKVNIVNDEVYLLTKKNVYIISSTDYNEILNDSYVKHISECTEIDLDNTYGNCVSNDCYILFTSLYHLYNTGIPYNELNDIGVDRNSKIRYLHIEIPEEYLDLMLSKISGYKIYFTNSITRNDVWIPKQYFDEIFTTDITLVKNNRVRDFIWYIREVCKDTSMDNDKVVRRCYNLIKDRLYSEWNELDINEVYEDFPSLAELDDFSDTTIVKLTIVGNTDELTILTDTGYILLDNILIKLKDNL